MHPESNTKRCTKCGRVLPLSAFNKHRLCKDGIDSRCRECGKAYMAQWRAEHGDIKRAIDRRTYERNPDKAIARAAAWEKAHPERAKEIHRLEARRQRERHPDHLAARIAVRQAIERGDIRREPCGVCGATPAQAHHHCGYAPEHWLDVVWRCIKCHAREHYPHRR